MDEKKDIQPIKQSPVVEDVSDNFVEAHPVVLFGRRQTPEPGTVEYYHWAKQQEANQNKK